MYCVIEKVSLRCRRTDETSWVMFFAVGYDCFLRASLRALSRAWHIHCVIHFRLRSRSLNFSTHSVRQVLFVYV